MAKTAVPQEEQDSRYWSGVLDNLTSPGAFGPFAFLKKGRTRIRITPLPGTNPPQFFTECYRTWKGQQRRRFMILGCIIADDGTVDTTVKAVIVPKTVLRGILELLAAGDFDLLSPETGHGLSITKTGSGLETGYTVVPSPKQVPIDLNDLTFPQDSLPALADKLTKIDAERENPGAKGEEAAGGDAEDDSGNW